MRGNRPIAADGDFYYTEAITDAAVESIQSASRAGRPFFLYVAFTAPHYPLHAREEYIRKYDGVYDVGWDVIRRRRYQRLIEFEITDGKWELPSDEAVSPWEDEPYKAWQAHRMQVYAAMVEQMDVGVGQIVDALQKTGQLENSLLVFLSDNGASCEGHLNNTIERTGAPWKSSVIPDRTRDGRPVVPGDIPERPLGADDTYGSYGLPWASVSNTPFRRHKSWVHEGGIAAAMIAHWPHGIQQRGGLCRSPAHVIDLMPTFLDVAGAKYPQGSNGDGRTSLQGVSLKPVFEGQPLARNELCWEHEGNRGIRQGKWKLVSEYPGTWKTFYRYAKNGAWELYDMEQDRTETNDLAGEKPDVVKRLSDAYERWAAKSLVVPWKELEGKQE